MARAAIEETYERVLAQPGVVFLLGGIDAGKTTFGLELARRATRAGIRTAFVDADIGQSVVGPPTTVGLKLCQSLGEIDYATVRHADALSFVGSIAPQGHMMGLVTGAAKLAYKARQHGCELVVVDTTGYVSGLGGQALKFHKMNLLAPDLVIAFERGGEQEP